MNQPLLLNVDNFNAVLGTETRPLLVVFSASWCEPCHSMDGEWEKVVSELGDQAVVGFVDVGVSPTIGQKFGIRSVPSLAVFYQGQLQEVIPGVLTAQSLLARTRIAIAKNAGA